ncbi:unnamed protein product, partial [Adineta steineri]
MMSTVSSSSTTPLTSTSSTTSTTTTLTTTTTTSTTTSATTTAAFNINLITNGDADTGSCQGSSGITSPVGWNYNGPITQVIYSDPAFVGMASSDPGPSDRGQCYFYGQVSASTSMWQTINLINE